NITTGQKNINSADVYGGHLAVLLRPSENLFLKLGALIQNTNGNGTSYVNSDGLGNYPQGNLKQTGLPGTSPWYTRWQRYTATLSAKWAGVDITFVTGYDTNTVRNDSDFSGSPYFADEAAKIYPGTTGASFGNHFHTEKVSQEIRLSSAVRGWLDWTA